MGFNFGQLVEDESKYQDTFERMMEEELRSYGGEEGFKLALKMERVRYNLDARTEHEKMWAERSFKDNITLNGEMYGKGPDIVARMQYQVESADEKNENKPSDTKKKGKKKKKPAKSVMVEWEEDDGPLTKYIDNKFLLGLFSQKPNQGFSYIGDATINGLKDFMKQIRSLDVQYKHASQD